MNFAEISVHMAPVVDFISNGCYYSVLCQRKGIMKADDKKQLYACLALFLCSFIWGNAFVAQSVGMEYVGPYTFQSLRSFLGCLVLVPVLLVIKGTKKKNGKYCPMQKKEKRQLVKGGIFCGSALCAASCAQQIGIQYTTVGKAGFITAMYIVLVPVCGIFLKKKVPVKIWFCIIIAAAGLYFLSMKSGDFGISKGDSLVLLCAFLFTIQILLVDYYAPKVDPVWLSFIEFFVSGIISAVPMMLIEHPSLSEIAAGSGPILYAGVLSCGVAYTLQIVGQKYADAAKASLIMSLESVFSLLGGIVLLSQIPSPRELVGCALVFAAVIWSQI